MLIQFNFKNFKSFKEEASLDMSATKITEFSDRVVSVGSEKILPVAAIYGANASGKSNICNAFSYMSNYVINSFRYGDDGESFDQYSPTPFLLDSVSVESESFFEVYFTMPDDPMERTYHYGFCVDAEGVTEEWMNSRAKSARKFSAVFYRSTKDGELDLSGFTAKTRENLRISLSNQVLVVSLGAKLQIEECKKVRNWFIKNQGANYGNPFYHMAASRILPRGFTDDKQVQQNVVRYLSSFDDSIKGFKVKQLPGDKEEKEDLYEIYALHKTNDSDKMVEIPLEMESAGTQKMFSLYQDLEEVLNTGSLLFVDELNASLHPLLVRNFLLLFLNPEINKNHAQLVFTVHDTWLLSNQMLRRDEIWFVEKDENGASSLYSLADFKDEDGTHIRKDESYEKNYLYGKYGAIPVLKSMDVFRED